MLAIKLKRIGKKHQPSFRIIVAEKRSKVNGRFVEDLGWFNPLTDKSKINAERVNYWLKNGAQPTHSVLTLLKKYAILKIIEPKVEKKKS
jgi:small subunit ribosomal protein S16